MTTWVSENGFWACRTEAASISRKVEGSKKGSQNVGNVGRKVASVSDYIYIYIDLLDGAFSAAHLHGQSTKTHLHLIFSALSEKWSRGAVFARIEILIVGVEL